MLNFPYPLTEVDSKVLETDEYRRLWFLGDPYRGAEVGSTCRRLDEITGSCYFVLPELGAEDGPLGILSIARGRPPEDESGMPSFWDSVELRDHLGGVYAHVTYDPSRSRFELGMNVGGETRELLGVSLEGATRELVCGRVLELYFEISAERIFASVHDRFANGDVSLDGIAPSTGKSDRPWGAPPSGHWWVMSGVDGRTDRALALPPGFGLSNLRITLGADNEEAMGSLLYAGALDHLVADPPERLTEKELRQLSRHVRSLREITTDIERIRLLLPISPSSCGAGVPPAL